MVSYLLSREAAGRNACLNPCCSGQWSRTARYGLETEVAREVLILVVVDNGLVHFVLWVLLQRYLGLNPCCSGQWSRTCSRQT